jgi:phenylacetate-CoA ligase
MSGIISPIHDFLSLKVLVPLSRLQRMARPRLRPVMRAYDEGMRFRREAAGWSLAQKRAWILERLRFAVRRAYRETDYYRNLFDRIGFDSESDFSFDDFARIPVLERENLSSAGKAILSDRIPFDNLLKDSTGGSTGVPTEVYLGPEERGWKSSAGEHFMRRLGVPGGTRTAYLWGHHLDPNGKDSLRERYYAFETNTRYFDCLRLSPDTLQEYHEELERWRPACMVAYATALGYLAEHILERGLSPNYPTRCFVTGAEKLLPKHRTAIEAAFGRPVYERYGSRDVGFVGFQPGEEGRLSFEIDWSNILVEPETAGRESSILITKLHADGMPMIRYRIGDAGRFSAESKPGHPTFDLEEVTGRDTDRIWLPDGRWITGLQIPHMMKDYPVREYVFFQREDYSVELKILPKSGFSDNDKEKILATVQANLPGLDVSALVVDEVPRTISKKWRPVISEVKQCQERTA